MRKHHRVALTALAASLSLAHARAQVITVNIPDDTVDINWQTATVADLPGPDGKISFSEALIASNHTPGRQTIAFAIPPSLWTLQFAYPGRAVLRTITGFFFQANDPVTIDARTQTAFSGDTHAGGGEVVIYGSALNLNAPGCEVYGFDSCSLNLNGGASLAEFNTAVNITVYSGGGSTIRGNTGNTIKLDRSNDNVVVGNTVQRVRVNGWVGGGLPAQRNRIGGPTLAERNFITGYGTVNSEGLPGGTTVELFDSDDTLIQNNWIGTTPDGLAQGSLYSNVGIGLSGENHDTLIVGNRIAGILAHGQGPHHAGQLFGWAVSIGGNGSGVTLRGNTIGLDALGSPSLGSLFGVDIGAAIFSTVTDITVGGAALGDGNEIAGHRIDGVRIGRDVAQARLSGNSIHSNNALGIDLITVGLASGPTLNDALDVDAGGNGLQNFPELTSAALVGPQTIVSGQLESAPLSAYRVEFFASPACDPSGWGEGQLFLGAIPLVTDAAGHASFDAWLASSAPSGWVVSSTATLEPLGATSEFSACVPVSGQSSSVFCVADAAVGAPCPCNNASAPGAQSGCKNSTGLGATLRSSGSNSIALDDLVLLSAQLPPSVNALTFMSAQPMAPAPFAAGLRCLGAPTLRYPVQAATPAGSLSLGPGLAALSQQRFPSSAWLTPGSTWSFQTWYRDAQGPCSSANLTNALATTFAP